MDSRYAFALVKLVERFGAEPAGAAARDGQQGGQEAAVQERSMQSVFYALMDLAGFTGAAPAGGLEVVWRRRPAWIASRSWHHP